MIESYITLSTRSCREIVINKSRFIGYASPVQTEEEALSFLRELKTEHRNATHHCFAYIIGQNSGIMRYSDDGEPGGTAGLPMMEVMKTGKIVNSCVVVVRYFGGVLLGTGGLVRAYTQSCKLAVEAAGLSKMEMTSLAVCSISYSAWNKVRYTAETLPVIIEKVEYSAMVSFHLLVRISDRKKCMENLMDASGRSMIIINETELYKPWKISQKD